MKKTSLELARLLRSKSELLIAGGPLPTSDPTDFLEIFDVVAIGEGEETMIDLAICSEKGLPIASVKGIAYKDGGIVKFTSPQGYVEDLDGFSVSSAGTLR